ncbi:MAG TPA: hypothetical protein VFA56_08820 [Gaiellaceae bacterium]|nr:hypothetical protein [Gaiellaceae bacterium]
MRKAAALALAAGALWWPAAALAHGDPVSDGLRLGEVFLPYDARVPKQESAALKGVVDDANRKGFAVRVAVVPSSYDVGPLRQLWLKPTALARYAGTDLRDDHVYRGRVVVAMPNGFGVFWTGHSVAPLEAAVRGIPTSARPAALARAAEKAVVRLAAQRGIAVAPRRETKSYAQQRVALALVAAGVVALAGAARFVLRRRHRA